MNNYFPCPLQTHQAPPEDDRKKIYECNDCESDICEGDGYYTVNGERYCENCVERNHHYAEKPSDCWENEE